MQKQTLSHFLFILSHRICSPSIKTQVAFALFFEYNKFIVKEELKEKNDAA
jgi:hypothetical protein